MDGMSKIAETLSRKLSLGAKIFKVGGLEKIFCYNISVMEGEKLVKASPCYLSTTAGLIAAILFISTNKVEVSSPSGKVLSIPYKVSIPIEKMFRANESQNVKIPTKKYIEIVTHDNFDFRFMGFTNCRRTLKYLQQIITRIQ